MKKSVEISASMKEVDVDALDDGECADDFEVEEVESGSRIPVKMADPKRPSQEEVDQHGLTHLPFRNWC